MQCVGITGEQWESVRAPAAWCVESRGKAEGVWTPQPPQETRRKGHSRVFARANNRTGNRAGLSVEGMNEPNSTAVRTNYRHLHQYGRI